MSEFRETVHLVIATSTTYLFAQPLAAFTDAAEARAFADAQDKTFTRIKYKGEEVWMPDRLVTTIMAGVGIAEGEAYRELAVPPWSDESARLKLTITVHEIPWNQMLGRLIPTTTDPLRPPTLGAENSEAPAVSPITLGPPLGPDGRPRGSWVDAYEREVERRVEERLRETPSGGWPDPRTGESLAQRVANREFARLRTQTTPPNPSATPPKTKLERAREMFAKLNNKP